LVIERQYVVVNEKGEMGVKYHSQIDCTRIKHTTTTELLRIIRTADGEFAEYRGSERKRVEPCESCPPELKWRWQDDAACAADRPDMVTPDDAEEMIAKYCDRCPVTAACAEFALSRPWTVGIWGGAYVPDINKHRSAHLKKVRAAALTRLREVCDILPSSEHVA
jgi:MoaA/NifB/PqqE/SkfB family radical SAM enzyme